MDFVSFMGIDRQLFQSQTKVACDIFHVSWQDGVSLGDGWSTTNRTWCFLVFPKQPQRVVLRVFEQVPDDNRNHNSKLHDTLSTVLEKKKKKHLLKPCRWPR